MNSKHTPSVFSIENIRSQFPLIQQGPTCYLDSAATSQKPLCVLAAMQEYYQLSNANVHRGAHTLSDQATASFEKARQSVQHFINANSWREIIWTKGATESINLIANTWGKSNISAGDTIVVSAMEHHANLVPWQHLATTTGATLEIITLNENSELDLECYQRLLSKQPKLVAFTHISNVLGIVNPVKKLTTLAQQQGAVVVIDGAQALAHEPIDVQFIGCDFYVASAHKAYGPTGIGFLYGKQALLETMPPWQLGGEMIKSVSFDKTIYNDIPFKFEAGTPAIAEAIGFAQAIEWLQQVDNRHRKKHEEACLTALIDGLSSIKEVTIVGSLNNRRSLVSFTVAGLNSFDIGQILNQHNIAVRTGHHCAMPLMDLLGIEQGCVRASLGIYNTVNDVALFLTTLKEVIATQNNSNEQQALAAQSNSCTAISTNSKTNKTSYKTSNSTNTAQPPLLSQLSTLKSWQEKLNTLTTASSSYSATQLNQDEKTEDNLLHGCTSKVWMLSTQDPETQLLQFKIDSNSKIIRGLAAVILESVNGRTAEEIIAMEIADLFNEVGLSQHLSPSRNNGVNAMVDAIKTRAHSFL